MLGVVRLALLGITAAALLNPGRSQAPGVEVELSVLDLGPASIILVRTLRSTLLFDSGPVGAGSAERLAGLGVARLDALILTGFEPTRAAGTPALLAAIPTTRVLDPGGPEGGRFVPPGTNYAPLARELVIGDIHLSPLRGPAGGLGVLVRVGAFRALIGGSLSAAEQAALAGGDLSALVLVVPRWGRELDSGFLARIGAQLAIVPSGPVSPGEHVLALLDTHGLIVRRGDLHGDLVVEVAGGRARVRTIGPVTAAGPTPPADTLWATGPWGLAAVDGGALLDSFGPLSGLTRRGRVLLGWGPEGLVAFHPGRAVGISLGHAPVVGAALGPGFAYALDGAGAIWVVDLANAVALGITGMVRGAPQAVAITSDGSWAAVTARGPDELRLIETATGRTLTTLVLPGPGPVVATADGSLVVSTRTPELLVLSPDLGGIVRRVSLPEVGQPLDVSLDGALAVVGTNEDPGLLLIDLRAGRVVDRIRLDLPPAAVALSPAGERLAVALLGQPEVWIHHFGGRIAPLRFPVPGPPTGLAILPQELARELGRR